MIKLDPNWFSLFFAIFVWMAGIIGGLVRWIIQRRKRKRMTSELKVHRAVLRFSKPITNVTLTLGLNAQNVTSAIYWITLAIKNTGSQAITDGNYKRNTKIEIRFGAQARVLSFATKTPSPAHVQSGRNNVTIDPLDLNSQEVITVDVLVTDFTGEIEEERCLLDIEQLLKVTIPSRPKLINNLISVLALLGIGLIAFFGTSSTALTAILPTTTLNAETNQVVGASVFLAGLIATVWSTGIFFLIHHTIPVTLYSKHQKVRISDKRAFLAADNVISAFLLFVFSPLVFYFSKVFIINTVFGFVRPIDADVARGINFSMLIGGFITTLLLIVISFFLGKWLPLREFDGD